jgi:hypothetical protein
MKRTSTVVLDSYRLAQYAQPLSCYICGEDNGFDWVRCRQCQAPLSLAQSTEKRRDVQLITAVGSPSCGKTTLLGVLMEMLARPGRDIQLRVCNSSSLSLQESVMVLLSQGKFPMPTPDDPKDWDWVHCELKKGRRTPVDIAIPDLSAGSLLDEWERPGRHAAVRSSLKQSSGLMLLLDAPRLAEGDRQEEFTALKTLSYLCELDGHRRRGWPGRPVAIVLTKTDQVPAATACPEQFVADMAPQFWDLCDGRLHEKRVFAVSVTPSVAGRVTDGPDEWQTPLRIEPKGVLAPFQWILSHLAL